MPMNEVLRRRRIGIVQILLSGLCFGFLGVFGKQAYDKGLTTGEILSMRFLLGGLILTIGLGVFSRLRLRMGRREIAICAGLGILGYAVFSSFYFLALKGLSASLTVLLLYFYPVLVAAGGRIFFGDRIPKSRLLVFPMALVGLTLLVWDDFYVSNLTALLFGFGSAVFYSAYILVSSRLLKEVDPLAASAMNQLFAGAALALLHLRDIDQIVRAMTLAWPSILGLAFICSVLAMSLFLEGLARLKSWEASILSTGEPLTAILLAILFLNERLSWTQVAGGSIGLIALVIVALPERQRVIA